MMHSGEKGELLSVALLPAVFLTENLFGMEGREDEMY